MRVVRRSLVAAMLVLVALASAPVVLADGSVALVVRNSTYAHIGQLPNPENDAVDMAAALQRLGFEVTTELDADRVALTEALRAFTRRSAGAEVSVVFDAGHGIEMDGVNYVVPVDARLERDVDVRFETVTLDDLLVSTAGASLRLVILDACRNNPLARSMQRTAATRTVSGGSFGDLNEDLLGDETLVAYAAAAGTTAADGRGRNSPYTAALLTHLEEPLELSALFRRVRAAVLESTDGEQRPHEYASLVREHYLSGAPGTAAPAAASALADGATVAARLQQETVFWESIRESTTASDFEAYLRQFPAGVYRTLATNRLAALREMASAPTVVDPPRAREPGEVFRDCPTCPEMVVVPAGTFLMGSDAQDAGRARPRHRVTVNGFALGVHEVTRSEYEAFATATGRGAGAGCFGTQYGDRRYSVERSEASWRSPGFAQSEDHPVVCVNWEEAQSYARWLSAETGQGYRLPSEAEWEYAARAGTRTRRYWGDDPDDGCAYANGVDRTYKAYFDQDSGADCTDGAVWTSPVGAYEPNAFGLHDMLGNVSEWTEDCHHDDYEGAPRDGSAWTRGGECAWRELRGGGWGTHPDRIRTDHRGFNSGSLRSNNSGLRVARTLD